MSVLLKVSNCAGSALLFSLCVFTPAAYGATKKPVYASETMIWSTEEGNNGVFSEVELCELYSSEVYVHERGWVYSRFHAENLNEDYEKLFKVEVTFALKTEESVSVVMCRRDDKTKRFKEEPKDLTKFVLECSECRPFLCKGQFEEEDLQKFKDACSAFPGQPIKENGHAYCVKSVINCKDACKECSEQLSKESGYVCSVKNVINIDIAKEEESAHEQSWVSRHPKCVMGMIGVGVLVSIGVALGSTQGKKHLLEDSGGGL